MCSVERSDLERQTRHDTAMCLACRCERRLVDVPHTLSVKVTETVLHVLTFNNQLVGHAGRAHGEECLKHQMCPFLHELPEAVQLLGVFSSDGQKAFSVLPFTLSEKLFPPFEEPREAWLKCTEHFDLVSVPVVERAQRCVAQCGILLCREHLQKPLCLRCAADEFADVHTRHSHRD